MPTHPALRTAVAIAVLLAGCANANNRAPGDPVIVRIDRSRVVDPRADAPARANVEVTDIRKVARMERTALSVSLGAIELSPPASELVHTVIQAKANEVIARLGIADPQLVLCGIRIFDVTTPSTPIYWDIDTKIEVVVRVRGRDGTVAASATDRTFVWPSEALIARVTTAALKNFAAEADRVLMTLLAAP